MGKTAACIKIVQVLSCRDIVSTNELAEILETNPRNIKEYIKELELCGYFIESVKGIYGGYRLSKSDLLPSAKLNVDEKNALFEATEFLSKSEYMKFDDYQIAMGKIAAQFQSEQIITPIAMYDRFPLAMDKNLLQERYNILDDCINSQYSCVIDYLSAKNVMKKHTIHPYKLFVYNGSWFVLAWNETINDFGYFKLNRMEKLEKTRMHFTRMRTYDEAKYLDQFGMKQNGDYYHIELELKNLKTAMQERIYGKNQHIEDIDDKTIKFSCDMQNKAMILTFVLSFGANCKVLAPDWLKEDVIKELDNISSLY